MTAFRVCNVKGCDYTQPLGPRGLSLFTTFTLGDKEVDLCPGCTKKLRGWIDGLVTLELPEGVRTS